MARTDGAGARRGRWLFWAAAGTVVAALLALARERVAHALLNAFDTGLYMQVLHRMATAGDAASSVTGEANFLGHHFQPVLIALAPVFAAVPSALTLFAAAAAAVLATLAFWRRRFPGPARAALLLAFLCHPAVAGRLYYGFVPEALALPALAYLAWKLAGAESLEESSLWRIVGACAWAGLCKENIWLVNAWVLGMMAVLAPAKLRVPVMAVAAVNAAVFAFLFFAWMPAHSVYGSYYGLGFFGGDPAAGDGILGVLSHVASPRSLGTLALQAVGLTAGLVFLAPGRFLLASVPGFAMILLATAPHLHHPGNHYPLLYLPFLWTGILSGAARLPERARPWPWLALAATAGATLMYGNGCILDSWAKMRTVPGLAAIPGDVAAIRQRMDKSAVLLTQDNLQPYFHDFADVSTIMVYTGNPKRLSPSYLGTVSDVVTTLDVRAWEDCRATAQAPGALPGFDVDNFTLFCQWLKDSAYALRVYEPSGILHYRLTAASAALPASFPDSALPTK